MEHACDLRHAALRKHKGALNIHHKLDAAPRLPSVPPIAQLASPSPPLEAASMHAPTFCCLPHLLLCLLYRTGFPRISTQLLHLDLFLEQSMPRPPAHCFSVPVLASSSTASYLPSIATRSGLLARLRALLEHSSLCSCFISTLICSNAPMNLHLGCVSHYLLLPAILPDSHYPSLRILYFSALPLHDYLIY